MIMRRQQQQQQQEDQNRYYFQQRCSRALCCSCRLSVSSEPESAGGSSSSSSSTSTTERFASVSSLAHAMVQERLDQMIKARAAVSRRQRPSSTASAKFVVMVAVEKCTEEPREEFRASMVEMIAANRIEDPRDLRSLLNYYVAMNSDDYRGLILEVFHEVCSTLFFYSCKPQHY